MGEAKPPLYKNSTLLSVLDSTENMLVKQRHSSAEEQAAEAEKQGFRPHSRLSTAVVMWQRPKPRHSLPLLAHRTRYSEEAVQGGDRNSKRFFYVSSGSGETNIKFHLKLKCNSSIPQHCKMTSAAVGPSDLQGLSLLTLLYCFKLQDPANSCHSDSLVPAIHIWKAHTSVKWGTRIRNAERKSSQHFRFKHFSYQRANALSNSIVSAFVRISWSKKQLLHLWEIIQP